MKALKTKADERTEIEHQVRFFLSSGGEIERVEPGISGRKLGEYPLTPVTFQRRQETRTLLLEEVKAIEARKQKPPKNLVRKTKPKRVLITDDFGEPLRWSWRDS